jgi:flagellar hook assembly protein FlgD
VYAQRVGPEGLIPTGVRGNPRTPALVVSSGTPNPFSATTLFNITLVEESNVDVRVYEVRGRLVRQAALGTMAAGVHPIAFDGRDGANQPLPSGVYFYRVTAGDASTVRKFVIAR